MTRNHTKRHGLQYRHGLAAQEAAGAEEIKLKKAAADAAAQWRRANEKPLAAKLRPLRIDDASFLIDSWCSSYSRSPVTGPIPDAIFKVEQRARINRLMPRSRQIVACAPEDEARIFGWICYRACQTREELPIVHYMCVRPELQGNGIGKSLIDVVRQACGRTHVDPIFFTHWTPVCKRLSRIWNGMWNPYLLEVL